MFKRSAIQEQFPINEKKLWWYYFLSSSFFFNVSALTFFLVFGMSFIDRNVIFDNHGYLIRIIGSLIIFLGILFFSKVSATVLVDSLYFNVTDEGVIIEKNTNILHKNILFKEIWLVEISPMFFISGIYKVKIIPYVGSKASSRFIRSFGISGFDHDTAVAFKEFLDKRIDQAKHGKSN